MLRIGQSRLHRPIGTSLAIGLLICVLLSEPAAALDVLGLYVGGAVGQGKVEASGLQSPVPAEVPTLSSFKENHSAFKVMAGIRPISLVGAEVAYIDFGHPAGNLNYTASALGVPSVGAAAASMRTSGEAAFAVLYLPIPVVDVYGKIGVARLQTTGDATVTLTGPILCVTSAPNCRFTQAYSATNTSAAGGLGAQLKFGSFALRAEYERFSAAGGNPSLATIGILWTFL